MVKKGKERAEKGEEDIPLLGSQLQTSSRILLTRAPDQSIKLSCLRWSHRKSAYFEGRKELFTAESYGNILSNTRAVTKYILFRIPSAFSTMTFVPFPLFSCMKDVKHYANRARICTSHFFPLSLHSNPHTTGDRSTHFPAIAYQNIHSFKQERPFIKYLIYNIKCLKSLC